jgi:hypothetical protein
LKGFLVGFCRVLEVSLKTLEFLFEDFFSIFTFYLVVIKVLISCTENPKFFIKVLDELDKKVIFDEKKISVGLPSAVYRLPSVVCHLLSARLPSANFEIRITFFLST